MREQIGRGNELFSGELRGHSDSAAVEDQILRRKVEGIFDRIIIANI